MAAKTFLVAIDLTKNQLQNHVLHILGAAPGGAVEGQVYYDSTLKKLRVRDDADFKTILDNTTGVQSVTAAGGSPIAITGTSTNPVVGLSTVTVAYGGTGQTSLTSNAVLIGQGASPVASVLLGDGQILIGRTGLSPVAAGLTGTANRLNITGGAGSITLNVDTDQFPSSGSTFGKVMVSDATIANKAAWGTAPISAGGTGLSSVTPNAFLTGNGTGALNVVGPLPAGQLFIGTGGAPVQAALTQVAGRTTITSVSGSITIDVNATQFPSSLAGDTSKPLVATGAGSAAYQVLTVAGGGTGQTSFTDGGVVVGNGSGALSVTAAGATGAVLIGQGAGADPIFANAGGDITGAYTALTVNTVGGKTAAEIADAVNKRHTQNTDTGTTATDFHLDSDGGGPKLRNSGGMLILRNSGDTDDADARFRDVTLRNLTVTGTQTIVQSNMVSLGDSQIALNEDITDDSQNSDGGVSVARLEAEIAITGAANNGAGLVRITVAADPGWQTGDRLRIDGVGGTTEANSTPSNPAWTITRVSGTQYDLQGSAFANAFTAGGNARRRIDAVLYWNQASAIWETRVGRDSAPTTHSIARKAVFTIGDNAATQIDVTHNLNTRDVIAQIREAASPYNHVETDVESLDLNTVRIRFAIAPALNSKAVAVVG